jgi:hypothetical protein
MIWVRIGSKHDDSDQIYRLFGFSQSLAMAAHTFPMRSSCDFLLTTDLVRRSPGTKAGPKLEALISSYFYISMPVHLLVPHAANSIIILAEFIHIPSVDVDGGCQFWDQQHMLCCYHIFVYCNVEYSISLLMASTLIGQVAQMSISTIKHRQSGKDFLFLQPMWHHVVASL